MDPASVYFFADAFGENRGMFFNDLAACEAG
jgi:hypothetical protein